MALVARVDNMDDRTMQFVEKRCAKCGKIFIAAPFHIYKDNGEYYCKWTCYNHREDGKANNRKIRKVELYGESGELLKVFTSATAAAEHTGYDASRIRDACREQKPYMGFIWKYRE